MTREQARRFVEFRVTKQSVTGEGDEFWEVVDRFRVGGKIVAAYTTEQEANEHRDRIRAQRLSEVLAGKVKVS
jgi:hypothetical protein